MKRILSVLLMITLLLRNTMSVSATSPSMVGDGTEDISVEEIVAENEESSNNLDIESEPYEGSEMVVTESEEELPESVLETSEETDVNETEAVSEESIEQMTATAEEETTMLVPEEVLLSANVQAEEANTVTYSHYEPKTPIDVSNINYSFKSKEDKSISSQNNKSDRYRMLFFAPVKDFYEYEYENYLTRKYGMWEEFYLFEYLFYGTDYVDLVVLDIGRSSKATIKDLYEDFAYSFDKSTFCYDTTEGDENIIWKAYAEYASLCEGMEAMDVNSSGKPFGGYVLINPDNEIVCYGNDGDHFEQLRNYVEDNAVVKPAAPTGIEVTNLQGQITFSWTLENPEDTCIAYSVDENGEIGFSDQYGFTYDGQKVTYTVDTGASGDVDNPIYRYKFRTIDYDTLVKSEYSDVCSNAGMDCPRNPECIKTSRIVFMDTKGNVISDIEEPFVLHKGETVQVKIEVEKYSGEKKYSEPTDWYYWSVNESVSSGTGFIYEDEPIKYWFGSFENPGCLYLKGTSVVEDSVYLHCSYSSKSGLLYGAKLCAEISVVEAEEGMVYPSVSEKPIDLYESREGFISAFRNYIEASTEEFTLVISEDNFDEWKISADELLSLHPFSEELPWLEQYASYTAGTIWPTDIDNYYSYKSVQFKQDDYRVYKFFGEYDKGNTFFQYERWVDEQIQKIVHTEGGALYPYKNADDYSKIKAVYDYVTKNISYVGTIDGYYHCTYGALYSKKATCEGYQQLTYRLLWELGVPNGCMTDDWVDGSDSVHAYNMVKLEGNAYYLDTSAKAFLKGTKSFGERDYQSFYMDACEWYIENISEEDYVYSPKNLQLSKTVGNETIFIESLNSFSKVKEAIDADITANGKADYYSIFMTGNMELSDGCLDNNDIKINLDLNGHTLKVTGDVVSTAYIYGGGSKTGSVKLAENTTFTVEATDKETEMEKVSFAYEGTASTLILGSETSEQTLTLKNIASCTANHLKIFGDVEYTGSMTAQKLTLEKGQLAADELSVKGDTIATSKHKLLLSGNATFKDMVVDSENATPMEIRLLYSDDGSKKGALKFTGSLVNNTDSEYAVILKKYDCTSGTPIQKEFTSGEIIATVITAADIFDESKICISQDGFYAERDADNLLASIETVEVSYYDEVKGAVVTKMYSSLKNAITDLNALAAKAVGTYKFKFVENSMLSADVTLPSYVKEAVFTSTDAVKLDFNGFKLKTAGSLTLNKEDLVLTDADIDAGTLSIPNGKRMLDTVTVKILDFSDGQAADISIATLKASTAIKLGTQDVLRVQTATGIKDVELESGALLIADKFTQISSGKTYAWADSVFVINETATIYNPILNADTGVQEPIHIYKAKEAEVNLLGKLTRTAPQTLLSVGILAQKVSTENGTEASISKQDYTEKTALFDTKISKFPLDVVKAEQTSEDSISDCNLIYQIGTTVYVGKTVMKASGTTATGAVIEEKGFAKWSDAIAYLNTYAHAKARFEIVVLEDFNTGENLVMPKKAQSICIYGGEKPAEDVCGLSGEEGVSLTYLGDISLVADTTIENIDLYAQKYNSKTKTYDEYKSTLKLNGKALRCANVSVDFTSVAGNAKAVMTLDNSDITVAKAVASLGYLHMTDASLEADNVTVTKILSMDSSIIDCVTKITLSDVISESEDNILAYGGNTSKNILTIKGNITFTEDADKTVNLSRKDNKPIIIRENAITLKVKSMEPNGYTEGAVLCSAQKAGSSWFVVGSSYNDVTGERTAVAYGTYKKNKNTICGELDENVNLYSSKSGEKESYVLEGGFTTLQDALSEIDKLAVTGNYYQIELMKSDKDVVTFTNKALTFPSKTAGITIVADSSMEESLPDPKIYFKGNLTLKSNTTFEEIVFAPTKNANISLGNFSLTLSECKVDADDAAVGISQISGSGVKKTSALILDNTSLTVLGNVNNVGKLVFASDQGTETKLISYGTVNVGDIEVNTNATLSGLAAVTRKKVSGVNAVTKVASKITVNGDVTSDNGSILYLDLYEKSGKKYQQLDFDASDMGTMEASGIQMAKGLLVTYPNVKALQRNNEVSLIKSAGYLIWYPSTHGTGQREHGAELKYMVGNEEVVIPCLTFSDAVTEINNQKVKRDYTITVTQAGNETSGAVQNGASFVPKALKMPTSKYINSLVLEGEETTGIKLGYLSNITFTCDTTLRDIDFVQMVKVKNKYLTMDEAKADYPAAVTVNTGGYALNIEGVVTFNTPLVLNGKNTGTLTLNGDGDTAGVLETLTNQNDIVAPEDNVNVIFGSLTAFKNLNVKNCDLTLSEYKSSATSGSYKASANKVTNLNLTDGTITVLGKNAKGSFTVANDLNMDSGELIVGGKASFKNVTLEGGPTPKIQADTDFTISGTLISKSNNATLETRRKGVNKAPYLNIKGNVILADGVSPIYIGVYQPVNAINAKEPVKLVNAPQVTAQLLTAAKAPASVFRPIPENTKDSEYTLVKVKSNIYVYERK